jgi:hypothetical protein
MYGQTFRPNEGQIIGKLDADGNLDLVVDPTTLTPDLCRKVLSFRTRSSEPEMALRLRQQSSRYPHGQIQQQQG